MFFLKKIFILFCGLLIQIRSSNGLILKGSLSTSKSWAFLGKFCFITKSGQVTFNLSYSYKYASQNLLFYYDNQWPSAYPQNSMTCDQKEQALTPAQIVNLTVYYGFPCEYDSSIPSNPKIVCSDTRTFVGARPRYWFAVISRCFPFTVNLTGINIDYYFQFTNGNDKFRRQFSADEFGILETSITFFILYFLILAVSIFFALVLRAKQLLHVTFKLFLSSILFEFLYFLFNMCEYAQFASSGMWTTGMLTTCRLLDQISQTIFLLMLILIAKGYTVTRGRLRTITTIKLIVLFLCYIVAIIIAFVYSEALYDPGLVNYFYNSPGGLAIICIKLIFGWFWFLYAIVFTLKNYPEKRKFYTFLVIFFSIWFWAGPLVIICANYLLNDHVRQFTAFITLSIISFLGHALFLFIVRPTQENKTFPYHVKANKVGGLSTDLIIQDAYPHHHPNEGGYTYFQDSNSVRLSDLFMVDDPSLKYQVNNSNLFVVDSYNVYNDSREKL